jgi:hypothetical protein
MYPDRKPDNIAKMSRLEAAQARAMYTSELDSNQLAVEFGGGVDFALNRALALRVGDLEYLHTYGADLNNRNGRGNLRISTGIILRMGTW